jgi:hypothetical protein
MNAITATQLEKSDNYFMDLENGILSSIDRSIGNKAIAAKSKRIEIPEWMEAVESNIDYSHYANNKQQRIELYKLWVQAGHGDDWFVD